MFHCALSDDSSQTESCFVWCPRNHMADRMETNGETDGLYIIVVDDISAEIILNLCHEINRRTNTYIKSYVFLYF